MEYSDIHKNKTETNDCNKENTYANTIYKTGTIEFVKQKEEEHYEQLRFKKDSLTRTGQASVPETGTSKICFLDGSLKRMQILLYINLTVLIVLCLALIVVVIVIAVPKDKVDGNWGEWSAWSFCDVKCGKGSQTRLRTCTNPPATGGGRACSGKAVDILICEMPSCKVDGNWGEWSAWSFCDVTCGNGSQTRIRTCTNPLATGGGLACSGKAIDIFVCEMPSCKVDGIWGEWSAWSFCDVTCGNGSQNRLRTCTNPPPTGGGRACSGKAIDNLICEMQPCKGNKVSFFARMDDGSVLLRSNQRLVFNKALNNDMSGYNISTGVFVAPVSGVYFFSYFIEVKNVHGKVDLKLENRLISSAIAYGRPNVQFKISGYNHTIVIEAPKPQETDANTYRNIACTSGYFSVSGFYNNLTVQPALESCPYTDGLTATGGNTAVEYVNAGEKVWIQTSSEEITTEFRSNGTSFAGLLVIND